MSAPGAGVTRSAEIVVYMKRELMELIKTEHWEAALTVCQRRARPGIPLVYLSPPPPLSST